ncbi:hypothetical protein EW146_g2906, partial [Bondarzewia mesenterica]
MALTLSRESSFAPDSTASMSHPPSPSPPPVIAIKRAPITYGRRKDADIHAANADASTFSYTTRQRASLPSFDEEVVPDSDEFNAPEPSQMPDTDDDENVSQPEDESASKSFGFRFSWKDQLQKIEDMSDDDLRTAMGGEATAASRNTSPDKGRDDQHALPSLSSPSPPAHIPSSPDIPELREDDFFSGSLPSLTGSSSQASILAKASSPSPSPVTRPKKKRVVIDDSDDDTETRVKSSPISPPFPHSISTPRLLSSPTPPTSEYDMSPAASRKGKGKERARSIAPLVFDEDITAATTSDRRSSNTASKPTAEHRKGKEKAKRTKAPTKKEINEAIKEQARLMSDVRPSLDRSETKRLKLSTLMEKALSKKPAIPLPLQKEASTSSDPIQPFSSSPSLHPEETHRPSEAPAVASRTRTRSPSPFRSNGLLAPHKAAPSIPPEPADDSDSDKEMPSVNEILKKDEQKRAQKERARELMELKLRALEAQQESRAASHYKPGKGAITLLDSDEDEDLEVVDDNMQVVAREEAADRLKRTKPSEGTKRQLELAMGYQRASKALLQHSPEKKVVRGGVSAEVLQAAAAPAFSFGNARDEKAKGKAAPRVSQQALLQKLLADARVQSERETRKKEQEWVKRGGKLKDGSYEEVKGMDEYVEKAIKAEKRRDSMLEGGEMDGDEDEEEDGDWRPVERGSASPEPGDDEQESEEMDENVGVDENIVEDEAQTESERTRPRTARRSAARPRAIVDSDADSDAENAHPIHQRPIQSLLPSSLNSPTPSFSLSATIPPPSFNLNLHHRASTSSFEDHTDAEAELGNETDKENVEGRMFDRGEDKENKAVVRLVLGERPEYVFRQSSGLFGVEEDMRNQLSMSPLGVGDADELNEDLEGARAPLKELLSPRAGDDLEDPFLPTPTKQVRDVHFRLSLSSLPPLFGSSKGAAGGLSQFFDNNDGEGMVAGASDENLDPSSSPKPAPLQHGFSQLFGSGTVQAAQEPQAVKLGGLADAFEETQDKSGFDNLRKGAKDLSLTFDMVLQPALEVDEKLQEKADSIFEKEQEYLLRAANRPLQKKAQLYVTENGFLTQTRPNVSSPELYRPSPSQRPNFFRSQPSPATVFSQRQPLGTIAFSDSDDTPLRAPLRRLQRRPSPAPRLDGVDGYRSSLSPSPSSSPTRGKQLRNAFDILRAGATRVDEPKKLLRSEFVEAEAVESDEDDTLGFGGVMKKKGDDDEEGENDEQDKVLEGLMDDTTMTENALAKNLVLEKVKEHQEEDDAKLEKLHRDAVEGRLRVKRRGRGIDLEDSESEEEDYDARMARLRMKKRKIDGDTLEALAKNPETIAFYEAYGQPMIDDNAEFAHLRRDDAMDIGSDAEAEDEPRETVTTAELYADLRRVAQGNRRVETLDPNDVSWVDNHDSEDEDMARVREVSLGTRSRKPMDTDRPRRGESEQEKARLKAWAKDESLSRHIGTGRSGGATAVTGLGKKV